MLIVKRRVVVTPMAIIDNKRVHLPELKRSCFLFRCKRNGGMQTQGGGQKGRKKEEITQIG